MADDVRLRIGGDKSGLEKAISGAKSSLKGLENATKATGKHTDAFTQSSEAARKALAKTKTASGGATNALTNLNRVIQDAPFGFVAISNNIDPLVQSFISLKKQAGSGGAAIRALLGTLTGPAGILFAVSAATSLFVALGPKIAAAFNKGKEAAEDARKAFESAFNAVVSFDSGIEKITLTGISEVQKALRESTGRIRELESELARVQKLDAGIFGAFAPRGSQESAAVLIGQVEERLKDEKDIRDELNTQLKTMQKQIEIEERLAKFRKEEPVEPGKFSTITGGDTVIDDTNVKEINRAFSDQKIAALTKELSIYGQITNAIELQNDKLFQQRETDEARLLAEEMSVNNATMLEGKYAAITERLSVGTELAAEFAGEIGAAVADLVLGLQNMKEVGESLRNVFASLVRDIAAAAAKAAFLTAITGGTGGFGSLFKGFLGLTPFASGGIVTGPTPALVGESGPEAIIPLNKLPQMTRQPLEVVALRVSGGDLLLTLQEAQRTRGTGSISIS